MNTLYSKKEFEKLLTATLYREFSVALSSATDEQLYRALALVVRQIMSDKHKKFLSRTYGSNSKQVYYLCMEFLIKNAVFMRLTAFRKRLMITVKERCL